MARPLGRNPRAWAAGLGLAALLPWGSSAAGPAPGRVCAALCADARSACVAPCVGAVLACRAEGGDACSPTLARALWGPAELPALLRGRPANLSLLEPGERAVVAAADARAEALRTRTLVLHLPRPGVSVRLVQTRHGFPFGFPIDLRRFGSAADQAFYEGITRDHFDLAVLENTAKWARVEPAADLRVYDDADADVAWAESNGFAVKGHTLLWGIVPPFSLSGIPGWLRQRFESFPLTPGQQAALRQEIREHVTDLVARYRGRISIWDVTNETLQPAGLWFVLRLGDEIVEDVFRWAHQADPDATLVFNEWITEVFTGFFNFPTAARVRDRVLELRAKGVPVHALGQQSHFAPVLAFAGFPEDLSRRTRIDDYAVALDTLAQAGLPVHISETNFIAPEAPEARAAQAEALMRLWWGHPAVEQIVFWGPWNKVAGRDEFDVGFWDDDGNLSRHGEAVLSLLNDRWRTRVSATSGARGTIGLRAHPGDYVAEWTVDGRSVHARFRMEAGAGTARVVLVAP